MFSLRQEQMKQYIEQENVVTIKALQQMFPNVSLMTIHRDLDALEMQGVAVKFRGGARSVRYTTDPEFNVRMRENNAGKVQIARKALELIQPNTAIFLDASTTNLALARILPDINLNIITTGPSIALELCRLHNPMLAKYRGRQRCCPKAPAHAKRRFLRMQRNKTDSPANQKQPDRAPRRRNQACQREQHGALLSQPLL